MKREIFFKEAKKDENGTIRENFLKEIFCIYKFAFYCDTFWSWKIVLLANIQTMKDYRYFSYPEIIITTKRGKEIAHIINFPDQIFYWPHWFLENASSMFLLIVLDHFQRVVVIKDNKMSHKKGIRGV